MALPTTLAAPRLRQLEVPNQSKFGRDGSGIETVVPCVRVVLVPDATNTASASLAESSWLWILSIVDEAGFKGEYYEFQYRAESRDEAVWQHLSNVGDVLLSCILQLQQQITEDASPIVMISHGLGGIPMKKAITNLSDRLYDKTALNWWQKLALIVIIGCPHPSISRRDRWAHLDYILRHDRKMNTKALAAAAQEVAIVANLCSKFSEAGITCGMVTTFETSTTRIRYGFNFLRSERRILNDNDFARTGVLTERQVALDLDDRNLRSFHGTRAYLTFKSHMVPALQQHCPRTASLTQEVPVPVPRDDAYVPNLFESTISEPSRVDVLPTSSGPTGATAGSFPHRPGSPDQPSTRGPEARRIANIPCYYLGQRSRNPGFRGRRDVLVELDAILTPERAQDRPGTHNMLQCFAICGLGGMGKTQIALEYAFSRRSKFNAIFWIQADDRTSIAESFAMVAVNLGIASTSEVSDLAVSYNIVLKWLIEPDAATNWLIIFDNVCDVNLLNDFWPSMATGSVLITTRNPAAKNYCYDFGLMLQPLELSTASELFCEIVYQNPKSRHREDSVLVNLLERLGGIPLAIVQVASLIRRRSLTVDEFSRTLDRGAQITGLTEYQALQADGGYHQSLFTVWAFESLDQESQDLLNTMSLLNPFNIQESILKAPLSLNDTDHYPSKESAYLDARSTLIKSSLITRNFDLEEVELHPLVQEILEARMSRGELTTHFARAIRLVQSSWPGQDVKWGHETSHRERAGRLVPHTLRLRAHMDTHSFELEPATELIWIELLKDSGWYLYERGEHDSSLPLLLSAVNLARKRAQDVPALLADVLMSLAAIGLHVSQPTEVLQYAQEHLSIRQRVIEGYGDSPPLQTHYDLAMGWATMAMAHIRCDQFGTAIEKSEIALGMYRSFDIYKNGDQVPYFALAHIGWALWSLGRYEEAESIMLSGVEADKKHGKGGSYGLGTLLLPLGNAQTSLGKYNEACVTHEESLAMVYAANGDNYKTAQVRLKVAEHYIRQLRYDEAWQQFQRVMTSFKSNRHYEKELARTMIKGARFQISRDNFRIAETLFSQAQGIFDKYSIVPAAREIAEEGLTELVRIWSR